MAEKAITEGRPGDTLDLVQDSLLRHMGEIELARGLVGLEGMTS